MDENFSDLQKLLRLKKYEAPPAEYFEGFLKDFHLRQREEIIKLPVWRIAWDRVTASFVPGEVPRFAYATVTAVALFGAVLASRQMVSQPAGSELATVNGTPTTLVASASHLKSASLRLNRTQTVAGARPTSQGVFLNESDFPTVRDSRTRDSARLASQQSRPPRYVLDARPVSYEAPVSF